MKKRKEAERGRKAISQWLLKDIKNPKTSEYLYFKKLRQSNYQNVLAVQKPKTDKLERPTSLKNCQSDHYEILFHDKREKLHELAQKTLKEKMQVSGCNCISLVLKRLEALYQFSLDKSSNELTDGLDLQLSKSRTLMKERHSPEIMNPVSRKYDSKCLSSFIDKNADREESSNLSKKFSSCFLKNDETEDCSLLFTQPEVSEELVPLNFEVDKWSSLDWMAENWEFENNCNNVPDYSYKSIHLKEELPCMEMCIEASPIKGLEFNMIIDGFDQSHSSKLMQYGVIKLGYVPKDLRLFPEVESSTDPWLSDRPKEFATSVADNDVNMDLNFGLGISQTRTREIALEERFLNVNIDEMVFMDKNHCLFQLESSISDFLGTAVDDVTVKFYPSELYWGPYPELAISKLNTPLDTQIDSSEMVVCNKEAKCASSTFDSSSFFQEDYPLFHLSFPSASPAAKDSVLGFTALSVTHPLDSWKRHLLSPGSAFKNKHTNSTRGFESNYIETTCKTGASGISHYEDSTSDMYKIGMALLQEGTDNMPVNNVLCTPDIQKIGETLLERHFKDNSPLDRIYSCNNDSEDVCFSRFCGDSYGSLY